MPAIHRITSAKNPSKAKSGNVRLIHIKYDGLGYIPLDELEAKEKA